MSKKNSSINDVLAEEIEIIGHRGAAGYEPENTLSSFQKAIDLGVDMVELDVYRCKTGELIVTHSKIILRGKKKFNLENMTLQAIKKIKLEKDQKIPTLEEVLELIDKRVGVNIELKGLNTASLAYETIEKYVKEKNWDYRNFLISSFNFDEINKFNDLDKEMNGGQGNINFSLLISRGIVGIANYTRYSKQKRMPYSLNPSLITINEELVKHAKERGMKVYAWPVNQEEDARKVMSLGVDGLISDYPDKARKWVRDYHKG